MRPNLAILIGCLLAGCGDSPVRRGVGNGRIEVQVGPTGGLLRDDGSAALRGFELEIPAGALTRLVTITVEPTVAVDVDGSAAVGQAFAVRLRPDPGPLLADAVFRLRTKLPPTTAPGALFVARRTDPASLAAIDPGVARTTLAADVVAVDDVARVIAARLRDLGDIQFRAAAHARRTDDALRLAQSAYERMTDGTSASLRAADASLAQALAADPYTPLPHLLRAVSRILIALDERSDVGPGLDSVGEAFAALGIETASSSVFERVFRGAWPSSVQPPSDGPTLDVIFAAVRTALRPALESALRELDGVPSNSSFALILPSVFRTLPGEREVDTADIVLLRSLCGAAMFWLDWVVTLDLDVRPADLAPRGSTVEQLLFAYPQTARARRGVESSTLSACIAALSDLGSALDQIEAETDAQSDDLAVFPVRTSVQDRTAWREQIEVLRDALLTEVTKRVRVSGPLGGLDLRLRGPLLSGSLDLRAALPLFAGNLPLAGTLGDPTLGGALPGLGQSGATELLGTFGRREVPVADIVADGDFGDWPVDATMLDPADPRGDASGNRRLGVDIEQIGFASGGSEIAFRLTVADGAIAHRANHATVFVFRLRDPAPVHLGDALRVELVLGASTHAVRVLVRGSEITVPSAVGVSGSDLELTLERTILDDLLDLSRTRVLDASSEDFDLGTGGVVRDRTRGVILGP